MSYNIVIIRQFLNDKKGEEVIKYLEDKLGELDSIRGIADVIGSETVVEIKAQLKAYKKLEEIINNLKSWQQPIKTAKEIEDNLEKDSLLVRKF